MQYIVFLRKIPDRPIETLDELDKRHQFAESQDTLVYLEAAVIKKQDQRQGSYYFNTREKDGIVVYAFEVRSAKIAVDIVETIESAFFLDEELDHLHAGDVLLNVGIKARQLETDLAVYVPYPGAEEKGRPDEQRHDHEGDQGQLPVIVQEGADNEDQHENIADNRHHARGKHLVEDIDVAGNAGHQAADGVLVEETHAQFLEMPENLHADVVLDLLSQPLGDIVLRIIGEEAEEDYTQEYQGDDTEAADVFLGDVIVNRHLGQEGDRDAEDGADEQKRYGQHHPPAVRLHIGQEAFHQTGIIGLSQSLFLVITFGRAPHSFSSSMARSWAR